MDVNYPKKKTGPAWPLHRSELCALSISARARPPSTSPPARNDGISIDCSMGAAVTWRPI